MNDYFLLLIVGIFVLTSISMRVSRQSLEKNYRAREEARKNAQKRYLDALYGRDSDGSV